MLIKTIKKNFFFLILYNLNTYVYIPSTAILLMAVIE